MKKRCSPIPIFLAAFIILPILPLCAAGVADGGEQKGAIPNLYYKFPLTALTSLFSRNYSNHDAYSAAVKNIDNAEDNYRFVISGSFGGYLGNDAVLFNLETGSIKHTKTAHNVPDPPKIMANEFLPPGKGGNKADYLAEAGQSPVSGRVHIAVLPAISSEISYCFMLPPFWWGRFSPLPAFYL